MARRGRRREDNVFPLDAVRRVALPEPAPVADGLAIALLSAPQLTRELIVHWLHQVASPCHVTIIPDPADLLGQSVRFDLVVVGHCLHPGSPDQLLATVEALRGASAPLVVVTGSDDDRLIGEALRQGVRGYIPTRLPLPVAAAAIRLILSGGTYAPPVLATEPPRSEALHLLPAPPPLLPRTAADRLRLSPREDEVLRLLRAGFSNRQIAGELRISENTVMVHVRHLLRKLGVNNRAQAVYRAGKLAQE